MVIPAELDEQTRNIYNTKAVEFDVQKPISLGQLTTCIWHLQITPWQEYGFSYPRRSFDRCTFFSQSLFLYLNPFWIWILTTNKQTKAKKSNPLFEHFFSRQYCLSGNLKTSLYYNIPYLGNLKLVPIIVLLIWEPLNESLLQSLRVSRSTSSKPLHNGIYFILNLYVTLVAVF